MCKFPSFQDVLALHKVAIEEFGGLEGVRDQGLIHSAIQSPFQTFDGEELFPTVEEKIARLAYGLICNHGFVDGNKRVACLSLVVFLELNNINFDPILKELEKTFMGLAEGHVSYNDFLDWVLKNL